MSAAPRTICFTLNGGAAECGVAPHETLVDVLRDRFALGGPRESCGQGLCGCCTVLVDSEAVSGCLYLAVFADGSQRIPTQATTRSVTTCRAIRAAAAPIRRSSKR